MSLSSEVVVNPCSKTPSIPIKSPNAHGSPSSSLLPFQRSLHPLVHEAHDENGEEDHHRPEAEAPDLLERHRPGKEKGDFQIEQNEKDRNEVVTHVELHAGVLESLESAFVRGEFFAVGTVRSEHRAGGDHEAAENESDHDEKQDGKVVCEHGSAPGRRTGCRAGGSHSHPRSHRNHTPLKIEDLGRKSPASDPSPPLFGADGETRTLTAFATAPSRRRVYQFHHVGVIGLEASPRRKRARPQSVRFYYFGTSFAFDFAASDALAASGVAGEAGTCWCTGCGGSLTVSITPPPTRGLWATRLARTKVERKYTTARPARVAMRKLSKPAAPNIRPD